MNVTVLLKLISMVTAVQFINAILNLNLYLYKMLHGMQSAQVTLVGKPFVYVITSFSFITFIPFVERGS